MVEEVRENQECMMDMSNALREAQDMLGVANGRRDVLLNSVAKLQAEVRRLQDEVAAGSRGGSREENTRARGGQQSLEWLREKETLEERLVVEREAATRAREEAREVREALESQVKRLEQMLVQAREQERQAHKKVQVNKTGADTVCELAALLLVPVDEVLLAVRQLLRINEQAAELQSCAADAAFAIRILAQVEEALCARIESAVTNSPSASATSSPSKTAMRRERVAFRSDPQEVVSEVEELVSFEKRWLTDALVNLGSKGVYEVSYRAMAKLQQLVGASDPEDTLAKVVRRLEQSEEHLILWSRLAALLHIPGSKDLSGNADWSRLREAALNRVSELIISELTGPPEVKGDNTSKPKRASAILASSLPCPTANAAPVTAYATEGEGGQPSHVQAQQEGAPSSVYGSVGGRRGVGAGEGGGGRVSRVLDLSGPHVAPGGGDEGVVPGVTGVGRRESKRGSDGPGESDGEGGGKCVGACEETTNAQRAQNDVLRARGGGRVGETGEERQEAAVAGGVMVQEFSKTYSL
jgi:hypothetical protein